MDSSKRWVAAAGAGVLGAVAIGYLALKAAPDLLASGPSCHPGDPTFRDCLDAAKARADERRGVTTATLTIFAGVIAIAGAVLTGLSYRLNRAGQITERFTRAIDQLGNRELDIRLGGIYALERIARDSEDDQPQVFEVLTAYVREHAPWPPKPATDTAQGSGAPAGVSEASPSPDRIARGAPTKPASSPAGPSAETATSRSAEELPPLPTDVQAVMSVLGRRTAARDRPGARLNLARTDLRGLSLTRRANVLDPEMAVVTSTLGANLQSAVLVGANLQGAELVGVKLQNAHLMEANLQHAELLGANLDKAILDGANLQDAKLFGADFKDRTSLVGTNLQGAKLTLANLQGATLRGANLQDAELSGANLQAARLDGAQLQGASYDERTRWPEGFDVGASGAKKLRF